MEKKMLSVKTVVAIGIGAALYFVLMRFVAIPTGIPNLNINLGIAVFAVFAAIFGPIAGFIIGFVGHTLVDLTAGWGVWWSWITASGVFGLLVGLFWKLYKIEEGGFGLKQCLIFNAIQIAANVVVWVFIARTLDFLIYKEPFAKVTLQAFAAAVGNSITVLVIGSLLAFAYSRTRSKSSSLRAE